MFTPKLLQTEKLRLSIFPNSLPVSALFVAASLMGTFLPLKAQNVNVESTAKPEKPDVVAGTDEDDEASEYLKASQASVRTRKDARTMTLSIPAPRGQITDRFGYPFAQNTIIYYPAIQMSQFSDESDEFVLKWTRERIAKANEVFGIDIQISDRKIVDHYKHRRWLPLPFKRVVRGYNRKKYDNKLMDGLILHPIYQRLYPEKSSAAHVIGYVGSKSSKLEVGPINYGDPLFWEMKGRAGLEKIFDELLKGKNGLRKLQYNSKGVEVRRHDTPPAPGGTVVTTIDMKWQKRAESVLRRHCKRGAFVVIDIQSGEVLVLASRPSYNLNLRVPYMKQTDLDVLLENPDKPLFARAFQAAYPPASAFKVVTAAAALESGAITKYKQINCPAFIKLGNIKMYDWSRRSRGPMNVLDATMLSNNPFFIQASLAAERLRPGEFMNIATRLGYGIKTGLPLEGESAGSILTEEYAQKRFRRGIKQGDIANASIGQGAILATPLQVAQSMAGLANNGVLPQLHLIKQLQNRRGVITMASKPIDKRKLRISKKTVNIIKQGMYEVVNSKYGTGKKAAISYSVLCGKTGTAQWGPASKQQGLAWFAGFFPLTKPKYAFAVLYEGSPHEQVSGGKKAGPMVPAFFNGLKSDSTTRHVLSQKALIIPDDLDEEPSKPVKPKAPGRAILVEEVTVPEVVIPRDLQNNDREPEAPARAIPVEEPQATPIIPLETNGIEIPMLRELPESIKPLEVPIPETKPVTPPKAVPVE